MGGPPKKILKKTDLYQTYLARKRKQSKALQPQITTETAFRRQNKTFQIKTKEALPWN